MSVPTSGTEWPERVIATPPRNSPSSQAGGHAYMTHSQPALDLGSRRHSGLTAIALTMIALARGPAGATPITVGRQACGALFSHSCGLHAGGCRRHILKRCRRDGPAECQQAQACEDSCESIRAECRSAFDVNSLGVPLCADFAYDRC